MPRPVTGAVGYGHTRADIAWERLLALRAAFVQLDLVPALELVVAVAVGDGARRMTYAEFAIVRGISPASAKRLAQRHRWGRQVGNDGVTRVTVPLSALVNTVKEKDVTGDITR